MDATAYLIGIPFVVLMIGLCALYLVITRQRPRGQRRRRRRGEAYVDPAMQAEAAAMLVVLLVVVVLVLASLVCVPPT